MAKATIVYIIDPETNEVLMAKKVRKVGIGCWFGYGGKIDETETASECIIRETREESDGVIHLVEEKLELVAQIDFYKGKDMAPEVDEPIFSTFCYRIFQNKLDVGTPLTTEEMANPTWFPVDNLPWSEMKVGDELFVPHILAGTPVKGWIHFSTDSKEIIESCVQECTRENLLI